MADLDLAAIAGRYSQALNAKPSKGEISADGIAALTDSVCDVPDLLREIERLTAQQNEAASARRRDADLLNSVVFTVYGADSLTKRLSLRDDLAAILETGSATS